MRADPKGALLLLAAWLLLSIFLAGCETEEAPLEKEDSNNNTELTPYPQGEYAEPADRGPFNVGVKNYVLVDHTRFQTYGNMPRTLLTEIWYPTMDTEGRTNTVGDMVGPLPDWAIEIAELYYGETWQDILSIETTSWRDATRFEPEAPFPLILFSHGLTAVRFQNYSLCEHLASHGFVVAAPDHYDNAVFSNIPGHLVLFNPVSTVTAEFERTRDVQFLVDELTRLSEIDGHFLEKLIDPARIGLSGHSYGGMTSYLGAGRVKEILSTAPLNPVILRSNPDTFTKPLMVLVGEKDNLAGNIFDSNTRARKDYLAHNGDKAFILMKNSGHYSATDACALLPPGYISDDITGCGGEMIDSVLANQIMGSYLVSFFSVTLKLDARYYDPLLGNHYPANIDYDFAWDKVLK